MIRPSFIWGAYEEVIQTSSQVLSNLDLERFILVLRTRFVHITSRNHQNCDTIFPCFGPNVYTNSYVAGPGGFMVCVGFFYIESTEGLTVSGFGEARDRACDPLSTRHSAYSQQHGRFLTKNDKRLCLQ